MIFSEKHPDPATKLMAADAAMFRHRSRRTPSALRFRPNRAARVGAAYWNHRAAAGPVGTTTLNSAPPLPKLPPRLAAAPTPSPALGPTVRKRVLIADDDNEVRDALAAVLESEGYDVDKAADGGQAIAHATAHPPDLVLLDLNMPNVDGWTSFAKLDRVCPLLPVIIITARPNQYPEAVRLGVDAFMEKPLDFPVLLRAIRKFTHEPEQRHTERITDRGFVTRLLHGPNPNRA